jgi:hypothetical protein
MKTIKRLAKAAFQTAVLLGLLPLYAVSCVLLPHNGFVAAYEREALLTLKGL